MKDLFAGPKVFPLSSGNTTPREERATSSKDAHGVVAEKPSPEAPVGQGPAVYDG